ncbi:epoxide hydrolase family protein [Fodinicola acaciae]|uniref:epoxide hydrolase family protein n=1 Tax=Fodinicola acaciae TaxID=2681555 RepID=UPI0013D4C25E|nr:epoxide hydrolase [Fodinicola acaciae]
MPTTIHPFRIEISQRDLDDLHQRLANTRWPAALPGGRWSRGVPVDYLRKLADRWQNGYDWRAYEAALNEFPQFVTDIDGQRIHFLHVRSQHSDALPLLLTHSWPNSVAEFLDIIGPLTDPPDGGQAFHVVAPSLPGFAFSAFPEPADERPWSVLRVAETWAALMDRLGYERYGAHGNDAGALVTAQLAAIDPEHVVAAHITAGLGIPTGDPADLDGLSEQDLAAVQEMAGHFAGGSGYGPYLANRAQTLSFGFTDSPVAQLAYIVERYKEFDGWSTADVETIDLDEMLTTVSLYWFTRTGGSSSWTYYEGAAGMPIDQKATPVGVSFGGPDVFRQIAAKKNNLVHWGHGRSPSHMVAMAVPAELVAEIRGFFRAYG